ncbi:MAG TPA: DUF3738 domain-containing protein, partial [Bryobacteraceae bacterium]|nr:DUF3738 domain-containing protein [Bryobacteraceae bacterium]
SFADAGGLPAGDGAGLLLEGSRKLGARGLQRWNQPEQNPGQQRDPKVANPPDDFAELPRALPIGQVRGISVEGTVARFCQALESSVDRPVVNESRLQGEFAFHVKADPNGENDFLERLHSELGIVISPARRTVQIVALELR